MPSSRIAQHARAVPLGDDRRAVGQEVDAPRHGEPLGHGADDPRPARAGFVAHRLVGDGSSAASLSSEGVATTVVPPRSSSPEQATSRLPAAPSTSAAGSAPHSTRSRNSSSRAWTTSGCSICTKWVPRISTYSPCGEPLRGGAHVAGAGQDVVGRGDHERRDDPARLSETRRVLGGAQRRGGSTSPAGSRGTRGPPSAASCAVADGEHEAAVGEQRERPLTDGEPPRQRSERAAGVPHRPGDRRP